MTGFELLIGLVEQHTGKAGRRSGRNIRLLCPCHDDHNPSLDVAEAEDGSPLVICRSCEAGLADVATALGRPIRDFLAARDAAAPQRPPRPVERDPLPGAPELQRWQNKLLDSPRALARLEELRGWTPGPIRDLGLGIDGERVVFPVFSASGELVNVLRYLPDQATRRRRRKMLALTGRPRDLCPPPETLDDRDGSVWLLESHADMVRAWSLGLVAVAFGGVGNWRPEYAARFAGRAVIVLADADKPGRDCAVKVAADLAGQAAEVRIVDLGQGRDDGYDLTDFAASATTDAERREKGQTLLRIAEGFPIVTSLGRPRSGVGAGSPDEITPTRSRIHYALTDIGNAERIVAHHGREIRYAPGLGWLVWDGRRWKRDRDGELIRIAKRTVRAIYAEAAALDDERDRKALASWARRSEAEARLRAAVSLAESELPVLVNPRDLDADPLLFNAANGTVDLRTGELRAHRREDLITRFGSVEYVPGVRSDHLERFLERITGGDTDLSHFLQRAVGYSLTGLTSEQVLFFAHGPTATGKSSFLEAVCAMFGDYAATADFETFLKRRGDAGIRNDIARLAGHRLVVSNEVDEGKTLAEGLLKQLTGGDTVTARFLYQESFEFQPRFKLWLAANHRPRVSAADGAMWRRIHQLPFTQAIPEAERDAKVKHALRHDPRVQSALFAWAVEGCLEWQRGGLNVPDVVRAYTNAYREENDPLREWLADCCQLDSNAWTSSGDLRASYEAWAERNGERPLSGNRMGSALSAKGCTGDKPAGTRGWKGIRVL